MAKKKKSDEIKKTDGRRYNRRLPSKVKLDGNITSVPAKMNDAKKNRISTYSVNAIKEVFGSEQEALAMLAEQAKDSFPHLKLLLEYAYGKAGEQVDNSNKGRKVAPVINFITTEPPKVEEEIIDVESEDIEDEQ